MTLTPDESRRLARAVSAPPLSDWPVDDRMALAQQAETHGLDSLTGRQRRAVAASLRAVTRRQRQLPRGLRSGS